jgi:EmrB/QacA subfamily drug resistance transporter
MTLALAALDSTVVTTAVPSIVRDLGGFSLFPWLFSIYLLTQAVTVPIYGRASDLVGRRPVIFIGVGIFLVGSVLCGLAWNMESLIAFRALQGLGAGAIVPTVQTVVGDLYTLRERARVTGYTASVWGVSSVFGPLFGGVFSQYVSWRWIFFVNVPIGIVAVVLIGRHLHEHVERHPHRIDVLGSATLTVGLAGVIFGLLEGGSQWAWSSPVEIAIFCAGGLVLALFVAVERRAPEPMMPLWILQRRPLIVGSITNVALGATVLGMTSYIPTWAQGVRHVDPLVSGLTVASVSLAWPLSATLAGRVYLRFGFRFTAWIGATLTVVGTGLFLGVGGSTPIIEAVGFGFIAGLGFGLVATPVLVSSQSLVGWERRGVVTASLLFSRTIGSAVGIAIFGSIANSSLAGWIARAPATLATSLDHSVNVASNVLGSGRVRLPEAAAQYVREGLSHAVHDVFLAVLAVAAVGFVAVLCVQKTIEPLVFDDDPHATTAEARALLFDEGVPVRSMSPSSGGADG